MRGHHFIKYIIVREILFIIHVPNYLSSWNKWKSVLLHFIFATLEFHDFHNFQKIMKILWQEN